MTVYACKAPCDGWLDMVVPGEDDGHPDFTRVYYRCTKCHRVWRTAKRPQDRRPIRFTRKGER